MYEKIIQELDEIKKFREYGHEMNEKAEEMVHVFRDQVEELEKEIKERNHKFLSKGDMSGKDDWPNIWPDGTSAMNAEVEHIVLHLRKEIVDCRGLRRRQHWGCNDLASRLEGVHRAGLHDRQSRLVAVD